MATTSEAKRALSQTIRKLRARLLDELGEAIQGAYRLSIDAGKAVLSQAARIRRARLEGWIAEQVRALPEKARAAPRSGCATTWSRMRRRRSWCGRCRRSAWAS